jgi:alpha,alpha-trehalose phosphorylase
MGSLWQALAFGFVGVRPAGDVLRLDPQLPDAWRALELGVRFREARVRIHAEHDALTVTAEPPVRVLVASRKRQLVATPSGLRLERRDHSWRKVEP